MACDCKVFKKFKPTKKKGYSKEGTCVDCSEGKIYTNTQYGCKVVKQGDL